MNDARGWRVAVMAVALAVALAAAGMGVFAAGQQTAGQASSPARAASADALLGAALHQEEVTGQLDAAIATYTKVLAAADATRAQKARAQFRIGACYERLGAAQGAEARRAYEAVVAAYGDQSDFAAQAKARLGAMGAAAGAPATTGTRIVWTNPDSLSSGRVSPDGRFMSLTDWSNGDLVTLDLATLQSRRITGNESDSWEFPQSSIVSPDCKQIAYAWYNTGDTYDLRVTTIDRPKPRTLLTEETEIEPLDWSPDGAQLLVSIRKSTTDSTIDLVLVNVADGSRQSLYAAARTASGAYSPDGRFIAYADSAGVAIYDVAARTSAPLIRHQAKHEVIGWTPDGKRVLFRSDRSGTTDAWLLDVADGKAQGEATLLRKPFEESTLGMTRAGRLYYQTGTWQNDALIAEMDMATGQVIAPPQPASRRWTGINDFPDWSPDGRFLAYLRGGRPDPTIVIRATDTGDEREIPFKATRTRLQHIRWTRDGAAILVPLLEKGKGYQLTRVDAQSGQLTPISPYPGYGIHTFDQSPDGKRIFLWGPGSPLGKQNALMVRDLASGQETTVIRRDNLGWFSVSPDGRTVAAFVWEKGEQTLFTVPAAGGPAHDLVRVATPEANGRVPPAWTPDGRYILFVKGARGRPQQNVQVWRIPAEGGEPLRTGLTVDELWSVRVHPDGRRVALGTAKLDSQIWVLENFLPPAKK